MCPEANGTVMRRLILTVVAAMVFATSPSLASDEADYAKGVCTSLGFEVGTDKHADCSFRVFQRLSKDKKVKIREAEAEQAKYEAQRQAAQQRQVQRDAVARQAAYERKRLEAEQRRLADLQRQQLEIQKQQLKEAKRARRAQAWDSLGRALSGFANQPAPQPSIPVPTLRPPINCYSSSNGYNVTTQCQ